MASDRARVAQVRKDLGLQNENAVPDSVIISEIETGKTQITDEVRQTLNTSGTLSFDGAEEEALQYFVKIRVRDSTRSTDQRPDGRPPKTVSHMRRYDFGDDELNYWRDRMVAALSTLL